MSGSKEQADIVAVAVEEGATFVGNQSSNQKNAIAYRRYLCGVFAAFVVVVIVACSGGILMASMGGRNDKEQHGGASSSPGQVEGGATKNISRVMFEDGKLYLVQLDWLHVNVSNDNINSTLFEGGVAMARNGSISLFTRDCVMHQSKDGVLLFEMNDGKKDVLVGVDTLVLGLTSNLSGIEEVKHESRDLHMPDSDATDTLTLWRQGNATFFTESAQSDVVTTTIFGHSLGIRLEKIGAGVALDEPLVMKLPRSVEVRSWGWPELKSALSGASPGGLVPKMHEHTHRSLTSANQVLKSRLGAQPDLRVMVDALTDAVDHNTRRRLFDWRDALDVAGGVLGAGLIAGTVFADAITGTTAEPFMLPIQAEGVVLIGSAAEALGLEAAGADVAITEVVPAVRGMAFSTEAEQLPLLQRTITVVQNREILKSIIATTGTGICIASSCRGNDIAGGLCTVAGLLDIARAGTTDFYPAAAEHNLQQYMRDLKWLSTPRMQETMVSGFRTVQAWITGQGFIGAADVAGSFGRWVGSDC